MREAEARMQSMEAIYARRLMTEVGGLEPARLISTDASSQLEQNELKTDEKIDMLANSGLFGSPVKKQQYRPAPSDLSEEEDVENSLVVVNHAIRTKTLLI